MNRMMPLPSNGSLFLLLTEDLPEHLDPTLYRRLVPEEEEGEAYVPQNGPVTPPTGDSTCVWPPAFEGMKLADAPTFFSFFEETPTPEQDAADEELVFYRALGPEIPPHDNAAALEELKAMVRARKDDPMEPQNLTRFHPDVHDTLLDRCLLTGLNSKKKKVYVLVSSRRYMWATQYCWNVNNDKAGERYPRRHPLKVDKDAGRDRTIYLYREIMAQMLMENEAFRKASLKRFGMRCTGKPEWDVERLMSRAVVHHRNHNPEDCRDENLILATDWENRVQARDVPGASGFTGVQRVRDITGGPTRFRACVTYLMRSERRRSVTLGCFDSADLALLARTLWMLAHPSVLPHRFTPTAREEPVWRSALWFAQGYDVCPVFGAEHELPHDLRKYIAFARSQFLKGQVADIDWRC